MNKYTGYRDQVGRKIMRDSVVMVSGRNYGVNLDDDGIWKLSNSSGKLRLSKCCDESLVQDVELVLAHSDTTGDYWIEANGYVYMDSYEIRVSEKEPDELFNELLDNMDRVRSFLIK